MGRDESDDRGTAQGDQADALPAGGDATCVRWYVAYPLSLRHIEEMMAERGVFVDHATVHRWALKIVPALVKVFRGRKRPVGKSWRMDETYIKVQGRWKYLYRAVDKDGDTVDFLFRAHRDKAAAQRYFEKAIDQNGAPGTVTVDKSGSNLAALQAINAERETPIKIRQCKYLNNIVEVRHEVAYRSCSHFSPHRRSEPPVSPGESRSLNQERL